MIAIGLKLLGLGRWLREGAGALFRLMVRYPMQAALIVAVAALGWQTWRLSVVKQSLTTARAQIVAEREAVKQAQLEAIAQQANADRANEALQDERNRITRHVQNAAEAARRTAVADYAGRMRIAPGCISPAIPAGVPENPAVPDGEAVAPELVAITRADLDALTQDAVQGAVRYEWLKSLVDSGQAVVVPEVEFGGE